MKHSSQMKRWLRRLAGEPRIRPATRAERGQALVIIAVAMIGLLAFVGLCIDAGILFIGEGHLRRAVDAAALAAAAQFRIGRTHTQLQQSAKEVVLLNGVDPIQLVLTLCDPTDPAFDEPTVHPGSTMCAGSVHRKLVKVIATNHVTFAFLGIIGFPGTDITADAVTEAASVDVVLVIDTSNSMTFGISDEIKKGNPPHPPFNPQWDPAVCNVATPPLPQDQAAGYIGYCLPFHYVKTAAVDFINHLYFPYDRLSIVTFDIVPTVTIPINNSFTPAQITDWVKGIGVPGIGDGIHGLQVSPPRDNDYPGSPCSWNGAAQPNPSECTNTSTGGGLKLAGGQFGVTPIRQESVWVVILLTDGAANASEPDSITGSSNKFCPMSTWTDKASNTIPPQHIYDPFCRDYDKTTRHTLLDPHVYITAGIDLTHTTPYNPQNAYDPSGLSYDADDYARDNADFVSCSPKLAQAAKWCRDSLNYPANQGGQGALLFGIGLGGLVIDNSQGGGVSCGAGCENRISPADPRAGYDAGDALLRYIANVGLDGDPNPSAGPDPCQGVSPPALIPDPLDPNHNAPTLPAGNLSYNCGNYYFAQYGSGLTSVFQSIASRIFTRLTQ